jgi:multiple sugar transport system substrate-binding protein
LFKKANVPLPPSTYTRKNWTWDDFLTAAKKLTVKAKQWGALVIDDTGYEQTFSVNNGDSQGVFSRDGKTFTLASPRGIDAVQWIADLSLKHHVQPPWSQLQPTNANFDDRLFLSGQVAMIFRPLGLTSYYRRNVKGFTWDIAPVPAKVTQKDEGSLIVFMIPKRTPKDKAQTAWQLLEFMAGPKGAKIFAESGGFVPAYKQAAGLIKSGGHQPPAHMALFKAAADHQTTINFTTHDLRARQVYRPQLDLVYTGQKSAKEVLTSVKSDVEAAMVGKF